MFVLTTFFREPLDRLWGVSFGNILFYFAIASCTIGFILILVWRQKTHSPHQLVLIAFTAWFITWVALTRDAKRYDFFIGIPLAFFTAQFIQFVSETLIERFQRKLKRHALHIYIKYIKKYRTHISTNSLYVFSTYFSPYLPFALFRDPDAQSNTWE